MSRLEFLTGIKTHPPLYPETETFFFLQPEPVQHIDRELSFTYSPVVPKQGRCCPKFFPSFSWEFDSANTSVAKVCYFILVLCFDLCFGDGKIICYNVMMK